MENTEILDKCSVNELIEALNRRSLNEISEIESGYKAELIEIKEGIKTAQIEHVRLITKFIQTFLPNVQAGNDPNNVDIHGVLVYDSDAGIGFDLSETVLPPDLQELRKTLRQARIDAQNKTKELQEAIGSATSDAKDKSIMYLVHRYLSPIVTSRTPILKVSDKDKECEA